MAVTSKTKFDWVEYSAFSLMVLLSTLVGIYFSFINKSARDTIDGYILGGKKMALLPIAVSLVSSFICGIFLLGIPSEVYTYGIAYSFGVLSYPFVGFLCAYAFLPVFYKLQVISVYEYMELRFNKFVRKMVSLLFTISVLIYTPSVIYGPALALNQVCNIDINSVSILLPIVCIIYTAFGGLKAVVWTDTLQTLVVYVAVFAVAIIGTIRAGGLGTVIADSYEGGRFHVNMDWDPRVRASFFSILIGFIIANGSSSAIHPSFIQRFVSLETMSQARWSVMFFVIGTMIIDAFNNYMGLVVYSHYKQCDPLSTGAISTSDQILPHFILDVVGDVRGLPGVFMAGIIFAASSTVSSGLNTLAGTTYEDFIEPVTGKLSDARAANIMKGLVIIFGAVCLLLTMVMDKLGSLVELYNSFAGPSAGAVFGIFILGVFFPHVNTAGAMIGGLSSIVGMSWIVYNARVARANGDIVYASLPISVDKCPNNFAMLFNSTLATTEVSGKVFPLYEISIFYYTTFACLIVVVVGNLVSLFTANKSNEVNRDLLSPLIHRFLPEYTAVPKDEVELKQA